MSAKDISSAMHRYLHNLSLNRYLLFMLSPVVAYFMIFHYLPMLGLTIAFQEYLPGRSSLLPDVHSNWVGLKWFIQLFKSHYFFRLLRNTFLLNFYGILFGLPLPIIFALLLNEVRSNSFRRTVQTISYLPHFVSVVVVVGMVLNFLSPMDGLVKNLLEMIGQKPINFMYEPRWFRFIYIASGVWQELGWSAIIYFAALAGVDPELYEAAEIDGAGRWRKMAHISLPSIQSTIIILIILSVGNIMNVGFEKVILMYNPATYEVADVIQTFVYRAGILNAQFDYTTAVGLLNSLMNLGLLLMINRIMRRVAQTSLW